MSNSNEEMSLKVQTHVALFPSAGIGHLTPFLRFAQLLLNRHNCKLTLIVSHPIVSFAESQFISRFLSSFPQVTEIKFHILPLQAASKANSEDPFLLQFEAIRSSVHLLPPLLSTLSPPLSAFIYDVSLISSVLSLTSVLKLPNYVLFPSCAKMFSFFAYYPFIKMSQLDDQSGDFLHIPGIDSIPKISLPPPLLVKNSIFERIFTQDGQKIREINGVLLNTFEAMEADSLTSLNSGKVLDGLPLVTPIGPLPPCEFERLEFKDPIQWLDNLPHRSVVFVNFGSRTAMRRDQMKEIGNGLVSSGYKFLWVLKDKIVDREDKDSLDEVMGRELMKKMNQKGMVVKQWVNQWEVLAHKAIGGFISHCGWNSLMEAAINGVQILAWPQNGDQMISAQVIAKQGLGLWDENWGWGQQNLVKGEELGEKIKEMMESELLKTQAGKVKEQANEAVGVGGSIDRAIEGLIQKWKGV